MIEVIAWDYDGVLNRNIVDGDYCWKDAFTSQTGESGDDFSGYIFHRNRFRDWLTGKTDLEDVVKDWLSTRSCAMDAQDILQLWFQLNTIEDPKMLDLLAQSQSAGFVNIIATNNESRRANYIENETTTGGLIDKIFASGRLGSKKDDPLFFSAITESLGIAAENILLIDRLEKNIQVAKTLGCQTFLFEMDDYAGLEKVILPIFREAGVRP